VSLEALRARDTYPSELLGDAKRAVAYPGEVTCQVDIPLESRRVSMILEGDLATHV
jgi:hypothetical protein